MRTRGALLLLAGALLGSGCVRGTWNHENRFVPVADEVIVSIQPGDGLGTVLERCGGPLYVYEQSSRTFGVAYGWFNGRFAGGSVSLPTGQGLSATFSYDDQADKLYGVVFLFDEEARVQVVRQGFLRDIAPELLDERRRPSIDPRWFEERSAADVGGDETEG